MKRVLTISIAICALGAGGFALAASLATKTVNIRATGFAPKTVTVAGGDSVLWKNIDTTDHQVIANNGAFASGTIRPGKTYTKMMNTPGTFPYHDALKPTLKGTVKVTGPPPSISIGASQPIVTYGNPIRLTGAVAPPAVGDIVIVYGQPAGQASFVELGRVQTTTNGLWDFAHVPGWLTSYKSSWKGKESAVVVVNVSPRLSLTKVGSWLVAHAKASRSFSGRWVYVQRLTRFGQWVPLKKVVLNRQSAKRFKLRLPRGISRLRIYMTTNQAGFAYAFGASPSITVRRR